ncbi:MAG: hypothetical protein ACTS85_01390, partial [Arsenophonus sp. NC-PG7-MAG3]
IARKAKTNELEIAQLSANNRQEIARLRIDIFKKRYQQIDHHKTCRCTNSIGINFTETLFRRQVIQNISSLYVVLAVIFYA